MVAVLACLPHRCLLLFRNRRETRRSRTPRSVCVCPRTSDRTSLHVWKSQSKVKRGACSGLTARWDRRVFQQPLCSFLISFIYFCPCLILIRVHTVNISLKTSRQRGKWFSEITATHTIKVLNVNTTLIFHPPADIFSLSKRLFTLSNIQTKQQFYVHVRETGLF